MTFALGVFISHAHRYYSAHIGGLGLRDHFGNIKMCGVSVLLNLHLLIVNRSRAFLGHDQTAKTKQCEECY